ncbi:hypothetical protein I3W98_30405 [Streptomyces cavourensis]|nr:hypothetical protein [Streptomyces cavourensis]
MDYCHPCRRHLNGALACAGCGTPAEALGPFAPSAPTPSGPLPKTPDGPGEAAAPAPGRRSRRRARGNHRRRGRTVLLAVGGLVLAAGALSLAELAMEPGGRDDSAADYVREAPRGPEEPAPDSASGSVSSGGPQDPGPVTSGEGRPVDPSASGSGPAEPPAPGATATASPTGSPDPDSDRDQEPGDATASPGSTPDASDSPPAEPPGPGEPEEPTTAPRRRAWRKRRLLG